MAKKHHHNKKLAPPNKLPRVAYPLTGRRLRKEVKAEARLQFGPQKRQLRAEQRASRMRERQIPQWFAQYRQQLAQLSRQTNAAYGQASQSLRQQVNASTATDEALRQRLRQEAMQDAALRGQNYDPRTSELAVAAASERRNLQNVFGGLIGSQRASQNAYLRDRARISKMAEIDQRLREAARGRSVNADLRDLARQKGEFAVKARADARAAERDFYLQRLAFKDKSAYRKFATKQQKRGIRAEKANDKRARRLARQQANLSRRNERIHARHSARFLHQGGGGKGKPSQAQRRKAAAFLRTAPAKYAHDPKGAVDYLIVRGGFSPALARQTVRRLLGGGKRRRRSSVGPGPGHTHR